MQTLKLKNFYFEKFRVKIEILSTHGLLDVGHFQLSVEILWDIFSVSGKIAITLCYNINK